MSATTDFVAEHPRSILITHRRDGGLQASPVRVMVDQDGVIVATTRAATAKAKNLTRDPRFTLCVISDGWSGPWMTIEGTAAVHHLPEALDKLRAFYLGRDGSLPPDDEFNATMEREGRVMLSFAVERTTPPRA
jgi:PPOX class probable F420-dependent enzyme